MDENDTKLGIDVNCMEHFGINTRSLQGTHKYEVI